LLLGVIAYNLGNLLGRLVLPLAIQSSTLTSLQQRLFDLDPSLRRALTVGRPVADLPAARLPELA